MSLYHTIKDEEIERVEISIRFVPKDKRNALEMTHVVPGEKLLIRDELFRRFSNMVENMYTHPGGFNV